MAWFLFEMPNQTKKGYELVLNVHLVYIALYTSSLPKLQVHLFINANSTCLKSESHICFQKKRFLHIFCLFFVHHFYKLIIEFVRPTKIYIWVLQIQ
jgi:hypothetical protein